jgi:hypothetical protein
VIRFSLTRGVLPMDKELSSKMVPILPSLTLLPSKS